MALRQRFTLALLLGTALLASACTKDAPSPPEGGGETQPAKIEAAIPQEYRALAEAAAGYRAIDACGLHDPDAAKEITGDELDEIIPSQDGMQECVLRTHKGEFRASWTIYLEVGETFDASQRKDAAPESIGGLEVFVSEDERTCTLAKPLDDDRAIVLRTSPSGTGEDKPAKSSCQLAKEYAAKVAPLWKDLPKRDSERTKPELTLAKLDPCTVASGALDMFGADAVLQPSGPFVCTAKPLNPGPPSRDKGVGRNEVGITLMVDDDPSALVKPGDQSAREVTVAGYKTVIFQGRSGCTSYIVYDPDTSIVQDNRATEGGVLYQQIRMSTATCDVAQQAAEKVLAKAGKR